MTTKNFNAKKMLMSAVAAVVFSFVFTTNANAGTTPQENTQRTNLESESKRVLMGIAKRSKNRIKIRSKKRSRNRSKKIQMLYPNSSRSLAFV